MKSEWKKEVMIWIADVNNQDRLARLPCADPASSAIPPLTLLRSSE